MPQPTDPLKPDDLAKRIAERLSESTPPKKRFSLRNSIVVGGLFNGVVVLTVAIVAVAGIFVGINWLLSLGDDPGRDPIVDADSSTEPGSFLIPLGQTTIPVEDEVAGSDGTTTTTVPPGPVVAPTTTTPGPFVTLPPTTTSTTMPPTTVPPSTSPPTTVPTTTSSSTSTSTTLAPDTTPPVFGPTPDITREATGPGGAVASFAITATDDLDGPLTPACAPSSGTTFPIGTTSVACSATDSSGNTANASFDLNVEDTTSPTVTLTGDNPQTITVGSPYMEMNATATDLVDGDLTSEIAIDSSSVDVNTIGSYLVTYQVTDSAGNLGLAQRTVTVE